MARVLTEGRHAAEFIMEELGVSFSRDNIVIPAGTGKVEPGTVLGAVTTSGKFIPSPASAVEGKEGAEVASAINIYGVDATESDVAVSALVRGSTVNSHIIQYDTTVADDAAKAAKKAQLAGVGIVVR